MKKEEVKRKRSKRLTKKTARVAEKQTKKLTWKNKVGSAWFCAERERRRDRFNRPISSRQATSTASPSHKRRNQLRPPLFACALYKLGKKGNGVRTPATSFEMRLDAANYFLDVIRTTESSWQTFHV